MKTQLAVSVIVPTYNEATYIGRLLDAISRQKFRDFEVIVSDADSRDGTDEVVAKFKDKLDIKLVSSLPIGPGAARNLGAKHAQGEWLLFLDADVNLKDENFVSDLLEKTKENNWKTSSAQMKVMKGSILGKIGHSQAYLNLMAHTKHPIMQGYCMLTHRSVFDKKQGFNETLRYGEDNDYAMRAAGSGLGFVKGTYYFVDPRRYQQEGVKLIFKNIWHEIYRLTHGFSFKGNKQKYEFGNHRPRKT